MTRESPLKTLRGYLKKHPDLRQASTQAGLAELLGCSESLISAVERGRARLTPKLAKALQNITGVDQAWLLGEKESKGGIPAAAGGQLKHDDVRRAVADLIWLQMQNPQANPAYGPPPDMFPWSKLTDKSPLPNLGSAAGANQRERSDPIGQLMGLLESKLRDGVQRGDFTNVERVWSLLGEIMTREITAAARVE